MMKKLLLADDHQIVLDGLKKIIEDAPFVELAGEANDGEAVLSFLSKYPIDIVCMDIEMPILDGIATSRRIKEQFPHVKILILSMYNRPQFVKELLKIGIDGFVKKDAGRLEFLLALEHLVKGDTYYSQHFTKALVQADRQGAEQIKLTTREKEVLNLLYEGLTTIEIAHQLFISTHTVESHRKNLLSKFGVNNTPSLIKKAMRSGLVSIS
ncbi:response regulator transcription factor [Fulvivirgaceae bacterium BMA12]|uniref:Response regulator transcription factor n=1 Tax=Agaribacillus aureus TaxID=3051825 RepID=A0ABT8L642_9BACT|nr:response regulator transcription factor [Fulvivirgaceae bacterium BMA12]